MKIKKVLRSFFLKRGLIGFLFFLSFLHIGKSDDKNYYVTRVIDGDTIELETGELVRYIGIDTPEVREKKNGRWIYRPQPFAEEAKALNEKWVEGKKVHLERDVEKFDKYGRVLAYVYVDDFFVNEALVRQGYARLLTIRPDVKHAHDFKKALEEAKKNHRGMWK
ncbi:MAG: thermonuclease family protein [Chlamydiae bacterium]|nr:thermonuclease family protein [Chlamydiota bacterium]MBI3277574.1 thermonuclease family protein [Chlamydiota bacterium]